MKQDKGQGTIRAYLGKSASFFYYKRLLLLLAVLVLLIIALAVWTASRLQMAMNKSTQTYVTDVSLQLSNDIDFRLTKQMEDMELLEDSIHQIYDHENPEPLKEFLRDKARSMDFDALLITDEGSRFFSTAPLGNDIFSLSGIQASLNGQDGVSFMDNQEILYSIPIRRGDDVVGVLAGKRSKENMQQLIQSVSFSGLGLTCIIHQDSHVVISPTNLEPFMRLDALFSETPNSDTAASIRRMQEDMKRQQPGVFPFTAVNGTDLILAYNPLASYDWVLLTLVPADLISAQTNAYIWQTFLIIAGILALFVLMLAVFARIFRGHYRQLERVAFVDPVTGGMNNTAFQIRCRNLLQNASSGDYAVVLLHIKDFKLINETYGREAGDRTLRYVMKALESETGGEEAAARTAADNFYLCLKENEPQALCRRLGKLAEAINGFNRQAAKPYRLILQPGAYMVEDPAADITVLQDRAKTASRNRSAAEDEHCKFYDAAFTQRLLRERELNDLFEPSLENGDFQVFLQPKVGVNNDEIGGAEALVRWIHPAQGVIFPSDFIPLFEKNGRIRSLDLYMFEQVCKTLRDWADRGRQILPISVNLSREHFRSDDALRPLQAIASRYAIAPGWIELELTESSFFDDHGIAYVKKQIDAMHQMGFLCSLDDFGSGYSSLGLLMEFDVDVIKFDRRFFRHVSRKKTRDVVSAMVELAGRLGVQTVAEGIENEEQLAFLREVGCDLVQGYVFAKPMPIEAFEAWEDARKS